LFIVKTAAKIRIYSNSSNVFHGKIHPKLYTKENVKTYALSVLFVF